MTEIHTLNDARAAIAEALEATGHHPEYIAGAIGAESLHGCLRPGAPLWVHRAGAATYQRIAQTDTPR